jgi:hypothetical protein
MKRLKPLVQGYMRAFHDGFHSNRKVLPAGFLGATVHASALGLVGMVHHAAMRADRTIRPQDAFQHLTGGFVVLEIRFGK